MNNQQKAHYESKRERQARDTLFELEYGLDKAIQELGASFCGIALTNRGDSWLATLKADFEGKRMVAFVGSEDLGAVFRKAGSEARGNKLRWQADKWVKGAA